MYYCSQNSPSNIQKCLNQQQRNLSPNKAAQGGIRDPLLYTGAAVGCNSLEDDGRHGNLKEFLLEGNKGQQPSVEQAKEQEDTLGTEDGGNVRVLQEAQNRFSVLLVDFDSAAIQFTHQCMSEVQQSHLRLSCFM